MNVYIYDIEVFAYDWIVVFRRVDGSHHTVIHNNNYQLKEWFRAHSEDVFGGFNNKHYDDWIIQSMLNGADNETVKNHNDFIIVQGRNGWEFPFIQFQRKLFKSFDLKDDLPKGLSLKAIEGNMYLPIVESSVPFDIDRPLTEYELAETIHYCKNDVDATVALYERRKEYIKSKLTVAKLKGLDPAVALAQTNAKLAAMYLDAKPVERVDGRRYEIPENLDQSIIPREVLDFFNQIRDESIPDEELFEKNLVVTIAGCECVFAWGGVHGAVPNLIAESDPEETPNRRIIVNYDVASLYPNSMLNFGYVSRSCENPNAYRDLVQTRLKAKKKAGEKWRKLRETLGDGWYKKYETDDLSWTYFLSEIRKDVTDDVFADIEEYISANSEQMALKLVINTTYGAMGNDFNPLRDVRMCRSVCISNQLAMCELVCRLEQKVPSFEILNFNTDGVMFRIREVEMKIAEPILEEWQKRTRFTLERDDVTRLVQKDVNNYLAEEGGGKIKACGDYVKRWRGDNVTDENDIRARLINNDLTIVQIALVERLLHDVPVEKTVNECRNIFYFQQIAKFGSSYASAFHEVDGERVPVQKVNRVYAAKDDRFGTVKKVRPNGKVEKIASLPDHCVIDNENRLTVDQIDKQFYIDLANERVNQYLVGKKSTKTKKKEEKPMAVTKPTAPMNVYQKLIQARKMFQEADVKKSGINRFADFKYFELADIVPVKTRIFAELGLVDCVTFTPTDATLCLFNVDNPEDMIPFMSPMRPLTTVSQTGKNKMNELQGLGAEETYQRRYLYMMALDIVEADSFDATSGQNATSKSQNVSEGSQETEGASNVTSLSKSSSTRPASQNEREAVKKALTNTDGNADTAQVNAIIRALKKLREKNPDRYEAYIGECQAKIPTKKNPERVISKKDADDMLIAIGEKIEEE